MHIRFMKFMKRYGKATFWYTMVFAWWNIISYTVLLVKQEHGHSPLKKMVDWRNIKKKRKG